MINYMDVVESCDNCFWRHVTLDMWADFQGKEGMSKEQSLEILKEKMCSFCGSDKFNFREFRPREKMNFDDSGKLLNLRSKKCKKCFWYLIDINEWSDFKYAKEPDRDEKFKNIRIRKCEQCGSDFFNFLEIHRCRTCKMLLDTHQFLFHNSLCQNCWDGMANDENRKIS